MSKGDIIAEKVRTKLGYQYEFGATGPATFDCSGLAYWAHKELGILIPRTAFQQSQNGSLVQKKLQPGDLVFFVTK